MNDREEGSLLDILLIILVLLVVTRAFGELAERARMPALVGELVAGVLLGFLLQRFDEVAPSVWFATHSDIFIGLADLGMFFLMLLAGIRMEPLEFARASRSAAFVAVGGMVLPIGAGIALGYVVLPESGYKLAQSLFLGVALAITAVPVAVRVFMDLNALESRVGTAVVAAALWDDLLSLFMLAVLLAMISGNGGGLFALQDLLTIVANVIVFFMITIPIGILIFPLVGHYLYRLSFPEVEFSMLLIAALAYAVLAEALHLHHIIGAFVAGMFFHPKVVDPGVYERVEQQMSGLTRGFLAPIFFVSIGVHLDFSSIVAVPGFVVMLTLLALASKMIGAGIPAWMAGFSKRQSLLVGIGMSGRGAVELVVAGVALEAGLFLHPDPPGPIVHALFSAIVVMALVTTVVMPVALRLLWKD